MVAAGSLRCRNPGRRPNVVTHAEVSRNESAGMFRKQDMTALVFAGKAAFIRRSADDVRGGFHNMVKLGGQFSNEEIMLQQACNNHIHVSGKVVGYWNLLIIFQ